MYDIFYYNNCMKKNVNTVELLAPAKDLETGIAAIDCGADAVYIGASSFGARHMAGNNLDDIKKLVEYAHLFDVKIHVTVNTILTDKELTEAKGLIWKLYETGVDAIIVQDMGLVNLAIKGELPPIPIHASTQCNNRTKEKVKFFEDIGVSRVILARELSSEKIKEICKTTNTEIETFIHGALCVSYSGQCYLSFYNGGRSANRGECAQPCRKKYSLIDENGNIIAKDKYLLSMKDFNASDYIEELINAGVKSFKIEGRLKDKNYVKNVVSYYRKRIDKYSDKTSSGEIFCDFEADVRKSFNRGFTVYFLEKREKCSNIYSPKVQGEFVCKVKISGDGWFEPDKKINLNPQDGICYFSKENLEGCLVNKQENSKIFLNKKIKIKLGTEIFRNYDYEYDKKLSDTKTKRKLGININFENNFITIKDERNNNIRYKIQTTEKAKNPDKMKETFIKQFSKTGESIFYINNININGELPFLPVSQINEIRRNLFNQLQKEILANYKNEKQKSLKYAKYPLSEADYHENIHNKEAEDFYKNCGVTVKEKSLESTKNFKDKELMRTKYCLKHYFDMCKSPKKLFLIEDNGKKYKLDFDCKNCEMVIKSEN